MPDVVLLIGLPGSGKTSFTLARLARTHVHLSKDHWPNARHREARLRRRLREALAEGRSVVVDNTNAARRDRAPLVAIAREAGARVIAYWLDADVRTCLARNARREGRARVPDVAIYAFAKRFEPPGADEGFDACYRVRLLDGGGFEVR